MYFLKAFLNDLVLQSYVFFLNETQIKLIFRAELQLKEFSEDWEHTSSGHLYRYHLHSSLSVKFSPEGDLNEEVSRENQTGLSVTNTSVGFKI